MTRKRLVLPVVGIIALLLLAIGVAGYSVWHQFDYYGALEEPVSAAVSDYHFDLFRYEIDAITGKLYDWWRRPGSRLSVEEQKELVDQYRWRALRIRWLADDIERIYADPDVSDPEAVSASLREQLAELARVQEEARPLVEAILERQVADQLDQLGLTTAGVLFPPLFFNFSELPKNLIVSPRDRIEMEAGVQLRSDLSLPEIEKIEDEVAREFDRSTLIEDLGGLGVWPTMVMDDSSLAWTLTTIAHEWVHTYLAFHPLGWHMFDSREMNIINETVATIVGDEVGQAVAHEIYGIPLPPPPVDDESELPEPDPDVFDFRTEMRRTRLKVDELLEAGKVEEAEDYMEARRRLFVEHGYAIRKLNQAYFAFHTAYVNAPSDGTEGQTGAAGKDPVGPLVWQLREKSENLFDFLNRISWISSLEGLQNLVDEFDD